MSNSRTRRRKKQKAAPKNFDGKGIADTGLTSPELIEERMRQGFDAYYFDSLYKQMRYVFGESWNKAAQSFTPGEGGTFPDYPDIRMRYQEIGRTRRIYSNQLIRMARVMYSDPQPEFPQVSKYEAEVRKQYFLSRYRGEADGDGEWADEISAAFLDGDGFGRGVLQICLRTNQESGEQQVHLRHSPILFTLCDRHERHPGKWRWVCFVRYMAVEDAQAIFGDDLAIASERTIYDGMHTHGIRVVRYFEYYDLGMGKDGKPTRAIILNDIGNEPWKIEENEFGTLPISFYLHHYLPGQHAPAGNIAPQIPMQEQINLVEKALNTTLKRTAQTIIDPDQIDEEDAKRMDGGELLPFIKRKFVPAHVGVPAVENVPGPDIQDGALKLYDIEDKQMTVDSGVNDFDRGIQPKASRTLGEDMLIDQRSQGPQSWSELQCAKFHQRTVRKVLTIGSLFDRDPVTLDIFGHNYTVNDPSRPASTISHWCKAPSAVQINVDSLRYQDAQQVRAQRMAQLLRIMPLVGKVFDPQWYGEELAKALGEQDPKTALTKALFAPQQPLQPPQMGMGAPMGAPPPGMAGMLPPGAAPMLPAPGAM